MLFQLLADNSNSFRCWLIWPLTVMLILCCVPGFLTGSISKAFRVVINFGYNYTLYFTCSVAESVALQNYAYAIKTKFINLHQCQECAQEYTCANVRLFCSVLNLSATKQVISTGLRTCLRWILQGAVSSEISSTYIWAIRSMLLPISHNSFLLHFDET